MRDLGSTPRLPVITFQPTPTDGFGGYRYIATGNFCQEEEVARGIELLPMALAEKIGVGIMIRAMGGVVVGDKIDFPAKVIEKAGDCLSIAGVNAATINEVTGEDYFIITWFFENNI